MAENKRTVWIMEMFAVAAILVGAFLCALPSVARADSLPHHATTTVTISVCGDGLYGGTEICDDGAGNNDGVYADSISGRRCLPDCSGFGPYCGDTVIQFLYSEECDDGDNTAGDLCSPICENESDPINTTDPGGGAGGESGAGGNIAGTIPLTNPTRVLISGKAYPGSLVHILKDGKEVSTVSANSMADFSKQFDSVSAGPATFGFWADDGNGSRSITFTTTFQVTQSAVTTVSGIYLPPTIKASDTAVKPGEEITFSGTTVPNARVVAYIDGGENFLEEATSTGSGKWEISFNTRPLTPEAYHTTKAAFSLGGEFTGGTGEAESGFGQSINFYVGEGEGSDAFVADLNIDGRVNIVDFSILLYNWGTNGGSAVPSPDINHDTKVNLTDFSIMIFYWTG